LALSPNFSVASLHKSLANPSAVPVCEAKRIVKLGTSPG